MTYSCARFVDDDTTSTTAQAAKHDLSAASSACTSAPAMRLLDVGCGWGSMAIHAAAHYDVDGRRHHDQPRSRPSWPASGSPRPASATGSRSGCRTTASSATSASTRSRSIGMSEHVGAEAARRVLRRSCTALLRPTGRLLNHAISLGRRVASSAGTSFIGRYVFPDGELIDVGDTRAGDGAGRLRGARRRVAARALRPHAAGLGRQPRGELGRRRRRSPASPGPGSGGCTWPARRSGSTDGGIAIHQVLGVVPTRRRRQRHAQHASRLATESRLRPPGGGEVAWAESAIEPRDDAVGALGGRQPHGAAATAASAEHQHLSAARPLDDNSTAAVSEELMPTTKPSAKIRRELRGAVAASITIASLRRRRIACTPRYTR